MDKYRPLVSSTDRTSISVDEAIANLLGWHQGPVEIKPLNNPPTPDEEEYCDSYRYSLGEDIEDREGVLQNELEDAKDDKLPCNLIDEKREALKKLRAEVIQAEEYLCVINDELNKGESSALRIDKELSHGSTKYITLHSFHQWDIYKQAIDAHSPSSGAPLEVAGLPSTDNPWFTVDPRDPVAAQPWYTPARYFARQLVKDDSTLLTKRDVLAKKIVQSLNSVDIKKRGGVNSLDAGTVKKALVNVSLR